MAILLIRHGETELNVAQIVQLPETPLSKHGSQQADKLGRSLTYRSIELILTSDYERARNTADRVAHYTGARLIETPLLRERNFGEIRGKPYTEFGDVDIFGPDYTPPGGESWEVFHSRVDTAWNEVIAQAQILPGDFAVITHGLVLKSLLERKLETSNHTTREDSVVANTSVTIVDNEPPWQVIKLACTDHLQNTERDSKEI
tara:strand:+ start:437 stop:1045 length:609 start_codon:yes stop_codon:yes gene_type:complete